MVLAGHHGSVSLMAGLCVQVRPLDRLSDLAELLAVLYSQVGPLAGLQVRLWLGKVADCVPWQGSAGGWNPRLDRDVSWTPELVLVRWSLRLCCQTG